MRNLRIFAGFLGGTSNESEVVGDGNFCRFECTATSSETSDIRLTILYGDRPTCIVSYRIVMYISEVHASSKTPAPRPKQTGKFLTVLRMFPPTVSSHECWVADCSRCEGRRRQMICRPVHVCYFLSASNLLQNEWPRMTLSGYFTPNSVFVPEVLGSTFKDNCACEK